MGPFNQPLYHHCHGVLTNIEPPARRRRAAADKMLTQAECHSEWSLYDDVFHPLLLRLKSPKPLWRDPETIYRCHKPVVG